MITKNNISKFIYYLVLAIILIFGLYIRTKLYIASDVLEDDECRLALGMMDKSLWQMFLPLGAFSTTPLFSFISKIIGELSNYNEHALKFLPYVFSIASLGLFYKICEENLNRKISILLSLFLFVINYDAIYFSSIFKTYSIEIFTSLLCLYYFPKINIKELNGKQLALFTFSTIALMLLSFPSLFFITAYFMLSIFYNYKDKIFYKKFFIIFIPFLLTFSLLYFYYLTPAKAMQMEHFSTYWNGVFSAKVLTSVAVMLKHLLEPNKYTLFPIILIISYIIYAIYNKKEHSHTNIFLLCVFGLSILASCLKLYPLLVGRTAVYLFPIIIILLVKLLDILDKKNILLYLCFIIFSVSIYSYFTPAYFNTINNPTARYIKFAPKSLMQDMIKQFNPKTDEIITTQASAYSYTFYAIKNNFFRKWYMLEQKYNDINQVYDYNIALKSYSDYYNNLDKNKNYWFYLIKEYKLSPQVAPTLEWLSHQNVLYSKKELDSYLYYISGIKEVNP